MKTMRTLLFLCSAFVLTIGPAAANPVPVIECGWENDEGAIALVGTGDPAIIATNVTAPDPVLGGVRALRLEDNSPSGTPEAWVAYLYDLEDGDVVTIGFWRYDTTPGGAPSVRIWGHWADGLPTDLETENGSAGGNSDYGLGEGWDYVEHTWTVADGHTGLVIEARIYSNAGDTVWIDDLLISPPGSCTVVTPCLTVVENETTTFGGLKAEYR